MGIADRDYVRERRRPYGQGFGGGPRNWSVVIWLIVINVAVFVLDQILARVIGGYQLVTPAGAVVGPPLFVFGHFSVGTTAELQLWRILSFQFLHDFTSLWHLAMNMLGLWIFGPMVEQYLGSRRFLAFYLLCGIGGPVAYVLLWLVGLLVYSPWAPLVGASAGLFGILAAAAFIAPRERVQLLFPPVEMELKTLAWVYLGIAAITVLFFGSQGQQNAGGEAAHLGGAAFGYLLISNPKLLGFVNVFTSKQKRIRQPGYMKYRG